MTLDDYEIRRTIWDSRIPIEFVLDSSEMMPRSQQSSFVGFLKSRLKFEICNHPRFSSNE